MEGYNSPKDQGYKTSDSYASINLPSNKYGAQSSAISLPVYHETNEQPKTNRKSKCPRGAILNEIGSCCGFNCTRACAISGDQ